MSTPTIKVKTIKLHFRKMQSYLIIKKYISFFNRKAFTDDANVSYATLDGTDRTDKYEKRAEEIDDLYENLGDHIERLIKRGNLKDKNVSIGKHLFFEALLASQSQV